MTTPQGPETADPLAGIDPEIVGSAHQIIAETVENPDGVDPKLIQHVSSINNPYLNAAVRRRIKGATRVTGEALEWHGQVAEAIDLIEAQAGKN